MTDYDVGQSLIKCADTLSEEESDLREAGKHAMADVLKDCRLKIGTLFNKHGSHVFGLPDESGPNTVFKAEKVKK